MLLQPHIAQNQGALSQTGNLGLKLYPMSDELHSDADGMCYVSSSVLCSIHVEYPNRVSEFLKRWTQPFILALLSSNAGIV